MNGIGLTIHVRSSILQAQASKDDSLSPSSSFFLFVPTNDLSIFFKALQGAVSNRLRVPQLPKCQSSISVPIEHADMKHLLQAIDNYTASRAVNRRAVSELKALVNEIREGSDEKTNLQEFYDALERLVLDIRSISEHSAAFLQRVRKAEAPGYYDIIKVSCYAFASTGAYILFLSIRNLWI